MSVTTVPLGNVSAQSDPQLIPAGFELTAPAPAPLRLTVSANVVRSNRAVIVVSAASVTVHGLVPVHPPPVQPANNEPLTGAAVSVTVVPLGYVSAQSVPQLMPAGLDVTLPAPVPVRATDSAFKSVTVSVVLPLLPDPSLTAIVVVPRAMAVARPPASIVATAGLLLLHVAPVIPVTGTGIGESVVLPLPSWP